MQLLLLEGTGEFMKLKTKVVYEYALKNDEKVQLQCFFL